MTPPERLGRVVGAGAGGLKGFVREFDLEFRITD